jgi:CRP-like cAMP-binding protein
MKHAMDAMTDRALETMKPFATIERCAMDEIVYSPRDPASDWYRVIDGAVRELTLLPNGKRDILDFLLPGDVFGLPLAGTRDTQVETVAPTTLERYPAAEMAKLAQSDAIVANGFARFAEIARERRVSRHSLLAHSSAPSKVGGFLLHTLARTGVEPDDPIELPMGRRDIAEHLGLSMETVCRALSSLRAQGLIALEGTRRIRIVDAMRLARLARVDSQIVPGQPDRVRRVCLTLATQPHR